MPKDTRGWRIEGPTVREPRPLAARMLLSPTACVLGRSSRQLADTARWMCTPPSSFICRRKHGIRGEQGALSASGVVPCHHGTVFTVMDLPWAVHGETMPAGLFVRYVWPLGFR